MSWDLPLSPPRSFAAVRPEFQLREALQLTRHLLALDQLLASVPTTDHAGLDFTTVLRRDTDHLPHATFEMADPIFDSLKMTPIFEPETTIGGYQKAYKAALAGRMYQNTDKRECSSALQLVKVADEALNLNLWGRFDAINSKVFQPFNFLALPAELRLQIYSHLLPRPPYISLQDRPYPRRSPREHIGDDPRPARRPHNMSFTVASRMVTPRTAHYSIPRIVHPLASGRSYRAPGEHLFLDIMLVSRKVSDEARDYLYGKQLFVLRVARAKPEQMLSSDLLVKACLRMSRITPQTRSLCKNVEIMIQRPCDFCPQFHPKGIEKALLRNLLCRLPNVENVLISIPPYLSPLSWQIQHGIQDESVNAAPVPTLAEWFIKTLPPSMKISWDLGNSNEDGRKEAVTELMAARGGLKLGTSVRQDYRR